jgi:Protein of unknown function (DUF3592)
MNMLWNWLGKNPKSFFFFLIGIVIVGGSLAWFHNQKKFIDNALSAPGVVVATKHGSSHPTVKFKAASGEDVEYPQNGLVFDYKIGDQVEVFYAKDNPRNAEINTWGAIWGFPAIGVFAGLFFMIMALLNNKNK